MRTITTTLYTYEELPTEAAKKKALEWMRERVAEDPPWAKEYRTTRKLILAMSTVELREVAAKWANCPLTGFSGDCDALKAVHEATDADDAELHGIASEALDRAWDTDYASQQEDEACIDMLNMNEYEFTENGHRA